MDSPRTSLDSYDVVIFDCDGVLLNTNVAKNRAFEEVSRGYGYDAETSARFAEWQMMNFGISRWRAFEELLSERFGECRSDRVRPTINDLTTTFATRTAAIYEIAEETQGAFQLIAALAPRPLYVASGSAQDELRVAFARRGFLHHFVDVLGSPTQKKENVRTIVAHERSTKPEATVIMIGDAAADADAADGAGIDFLFVSAYSTVRTEMLERSRLQGYRTVETLSELLA